VSVSVSDISFYFLSTGVSVRYIIIFPVNKCQCQIYHSIPVNRCQCQWYHSIPVNRCQCQIYHYIPVNRWQCQIYHSIPVNRCQCQIYHSIPVNRCQCQIYHSSSCQQVSVSDISLYFLSTGVSVSVRYIILFLPTGVSVNKFISLYLLLLFFDVSFNVVIISL